jgi:IMP dehydrogenase
MNDKIVDHTALTFDDVLLLPNYSDVRRDEVDLKTQLTKNITLDIPLLSAPMDTVTTAALAIALGNLGGLGIIHRNLSIEAEAREIEKAKKHTKLVGAAVGVGKDLEERVKAVIDAGADVVLLDSAHGYTKGIIESTRYISEHYPEVGLISGSVATAAGAKALIEAGAQCLRVGMGPGSICTTRIVSGMGIPQITAIMEAVSVAKEFGVPVIGDGGIRYTGDIVKAIAAGASTVMMGSMFAGTDEAPGEIIEVHEKKYKTYRGMGSVEAMKDGSAARYGQEYHKGQERKLIAEGVEGMVPYKGSVTDVVGQMIGGLRTGMYYTGAHTIQELQEHTRFIKITTASMVESHPHDIYLKEK